jgi:membrane protease YdiL (CAAX protease family)
LTEIAERNDAAIPLWRRIVDFPLVAMVIAIALFILAAGIGDVAGRAIDFHSTVAKMVVRNAVIFTLVLLTYKLVITRLGTAPRDDLRARQAWPNLGFGLVIGFLLMAASVGIAAASGVYDLVGEGDSSQFVHELITAAIMPAFMEELLFRGILFRWTEEFAGSWIALLLTSALFGLVHIMNPGATWFSSSAIAVEAGLLLGGAYMLTRSLWLPMGLHAAWNFTQGEIFDVPVSGNAEHGLLNARLSGPALLSGGEFGLEASVICLLLASTAGVWFLWLAVRRGEVIRPLWLRRSVPISP